MDVDLSEVGRRIAQLRTGGGWRLADLAEATGYTRSYLSQLERGTSIPSLTALATVAGALGVEIVDLLQDLTGPRITLTRAGAGEEIRFPNGTTFHVVSRIGGERPYTAIVQNLAPDPVETRLIGERFLAVLDGGVDVTVAGQCHHVDAGDAVHYGAHEAHTVAATTDGVEVLIVSRPAIL
jgi:transcriptional regulator with XRE-family HTH domain